MKIRILTYNIHKCIGGVDRLYRPERVLQVLDALSADIILLQEVDEGVPRSRMDDQVMLLSEALDMPHRAFQRNVKLTTGYYGNAMLSRYPLRNIQHIDLTVPLKKRRRALVAECFPHNRHTHKLLLVNCHLGLAGIERAVQVRRMLSCHAVSRLHHTTAVVLGGDFNDAWGTLGKRHLQPSGFQAVAKKARTFPAILPVRMLDNLYYRGRLVSEHVFTGHSEMARLASDHLPLVADFRIG